MCAPRLAAALRCGDAVLMNELRCKALRTPREPSLNRAPATNSTLAAVVVWAWGAAARSSARASRMSSTPRCPPLSSDTRDSSSPKLGLATVTSTCQALVCCLLSTMAA
eukprot:CAMPEP_0181224418 /NCGR_PEP_ID=MMETSP1096-20121128/31114_1 /TAXON_ID=156174 ORGANISM="Chrysochromulina ericina, Strain CCMP281" /NCGR_SAMPLE_ID=MMETSP1096 /ASSEMBLY_ACC=CAM_ASM_000453 /LENGTH=108 /DNA_ID=CAMNT_0023317495 /DNA_START=123 /DNA_END=449 /DNA_ORIENTATION=-